MIEVILLSASIVVILVGIAMVVIAVNCYISECVDTADYYSGEMADYQNVSITGLKNDR